MKVTIITLGSRGDVQPYIALAKGLKKSGHDVKIATHLIFKDFVSQHSINFHPVPPDDVRKIFDSKLGGDFASGKPLSSFIGGYRFFKSFAPELIKMLNACYEASKGSDLIINSLVSPGQLIAEKMNIPCVLCCLWPIGTTSLYRHPAVTFNTGIFNKYTHGILDKIGFIIYMKPLTVWRKFNKMPKMKLSDGMYGYIKKKNYPWIYGFSENILKRPADWPAFRHITGYWFLEENSNWTPPAKLENFIMTGPPPVYIGLGSVIYSDKKTVTDIIIKALEKTGNKGIISSGWGKIGDAGSAKNIFIIEDIPHSWLFPKMAGAVIHGGAGTTAAALKAGIPTLIIPFMADQFFWSEYIYRNELGPKPLKVKHLTVNSLAYKINELIKNKDYRNNAKTMAQKINSEDGVSKAVKIIENYFA